MLTTSQRVFGGWLGTERQDCPLACWHFAEEPSRSETSCAWNVSAKGLRAQRDMGASGQMALAFQDRSWSRRPVVTKEQLKAIKSGSRRAECWTSCLVNVMYYWISILFIIPFSFLLGQGSVHGDYLSFSIHSNNPACWVELRKSNCSKFSRNVHLRFSIVPASIFTTGVSCSLLFNWIFHSIHLPNHAF